MHWRELLRGGAEKIGIAVSDKAVAKLEVYLGLLEVWSSRVNLVRFRDREELVRRHVLDSLWCAFGVSWVPGLRAIDVGSGAGFPGVPLSICFPGVEWVFLEAQRRRCLFLEEVVSRLGLEGRVVWGRAEEVAHRPSYRDSFDRAVARALAPLGVTLELTLPFLRPGGLLVALRGRGGLAEANAAGRALAVLRGRVLGVHSYSLGEGDLRSVVIVEKEGATPSQYPRRPGIPKKRPLG